MPSLREIEKTLTVFWLDRQAREWALENPVADNNDAGDSNSTSTSSKSNEQKRSSKQRSSKKAPKAAPASASQLNTEVLKELDLEGAALYGRMINFGQYDLLSSIYPFCEKVIGKEWDDLVYDYYRQFPSDHYNLNKSCRHLSEYFSKFAAKLCQKYPFLSELADYEWLEVEKMEDAPQIIKAEDVSISNLEMISTYFPAVNQTLTLRHYEYPMAEMIAHFESDEKPVRKKFVRRQCHMAFYRDPETHRVRFMELGEATAAIVEKAQVEPTIYQDLLRLTIELTPELNPQNVAMEFLGLIEELHTDNIFVGSHKKGTK